MSGYCKKCGWQVCICDEIKPLSSDAVLAEVRATLINNSEDDGTGLMIIKLDDVLKILDEHFR